MGIFKNLFGIWGEKVERLFSFSPTILAFEGIREGRKTDRYLHIEEQQLGQIQEYVKEHRVSLALKTFTKWMSNMKKAIENAVKGGFTQIFQEFHILKITKHFGESLQKLVVHSRNYGGEFRGRLKRIILTYLPKMIADIEESEKLHGEDTRTYMAIMNKAKSKGVAKAVIALRRAFKTSMSKLGRIAMRRDIKIELRDEKSLKRLADRLESLSAKLDSEKKQEHEKALQEFEQIMAQGEHDMSEMFRDGHLVMKRDLQYILVLLQDDDIIELYGPEWVQTHFMPEKPINEGLMSMNKLKQSLFEKAHTMANGLGVVTKNLDRIKQEFEVELREAEALRPAA